MLGVSEHSSVSTVVLSQYEMSVSLPRQVKPFSNISVPEDSKYPLFNSVTFLFSMK